MQHLHGGQRDFFLMKFFIVEVLSMLTNLIACHIQAYFNQGNLPKMHKYDEALFEDVLKPLCGCISTRRSATQPSNANFFQDGRIFPIQASYSEFQNSNFVSFLSSKKLIHSEKLNSELQEMIPCQNSGFLKLDFSNSSSELKHLMFLNQISVNQV